MCCSKWYTMKICGEWKYSTIHSLSMHEMEVCGQLLCSGCFTAKENNTDSHSLGGLVGHRAGLNALSK